MIIKYQILQFQNMGCIPTRSIANQQLRKTNLEGSFNRQSLKTQTCSTLATFSNKSIRDKLINKSSLNSLPNIFVLKSSSFKSNQINSSSLRILTNKIKVRGPGTNSYQFQVTNQIYKIQLELQMLYGFAYENVVLIFEDSTDNSQKIKGSLRFFLHDKVRLFVKMSVVCPICSRNTVQTFSKAIFKLLNTNCQCQSQAYKIIIRQIMPIQCTLWIDHKQKHFPIRQKSKKQYTVHKNSTVRLIGCTSCWRFSNLEKRLCLCAYCRNCEHETCEVCKLEA